MDQSERNKRKQKWLAHGFGIAKGMRESAITITNILDNVSDGKMTEFDGYTEVLHQIETTLYDCQVGNFTEKFLIFMLAEIDTKQ